MADFNRTEDAAESFRNKRRPKTDIKFKVTLNEEQKIAKSIIMENEIIIITGNAGTGKTLVVAQTVLDLLFKGEVEKVFITRPTQQVGASLGFLPGQLAEKLNPYLDPFKDNLHICYEQVKVDKLLEENKIEGTAIQYVRGKTFGKNRVLIVDESQNTNKVEMLAILTRLGKGGKIIIIGDISQKDTNVQLDGLAYAIEAAKKIPEIKWIKLKENHRSGLVAKILEYEYGKN